MQTHTRAGASSPIRSARRTVGHRRWSSELVALVVLLPACSSSEPNSATGTTDEAGFEQAIAGEDGVPILTSDAEILGPPTIVYPRLDEPSDAVWRLLARRGDPDTPIVNVEIRPDDVFDPAKATTELFDGRPAAVEAFDNGVTQLTFAAADGGWVQFASRELEELSLIGLAGPVDVRRGDLILAGDDWAVVGDVALPLFEHGHQTLFNAPRLPGVQVEIASSRLTGDLDVWYEWADAERVEGTPFDWAFRQRSEVVGVDRFVALWSDDVVVEIDNIADDVVLSEVIDGLREMRPGETELVASG